MLLSPLVNYLKLSTQKRILGVSYLVRLSAFLPNFKIINFVVSHNEFELKVSDF